MAEKSKKIVELLNKTRDFASRAVNVAKLSHILGRFGAPTLRRPRLSRGNGAYVTPLYLWDQLTHILVIY